MQSSAPGTGRRAKNLSRYEVEPLRRVVGEPEADESLVVFVMVDVRVLDPAVVRDVEGPPILRLDRAGDRSEPIADERRNVLPVFRSGGGGRVEDLLRLPLHVPGESEKILHTASAARPKYREDIAAFVRDRLGPEDL